MEVCSDAPAPADKRRQKTKCNGGSAAWIRRRPHRTANNQQENGKERENLKTLCSARDTHKFETKPSKLITISSSLQIIIIIMLAWKGRAKRVRARKLLPSVFSVEHQRIKNCCFSCASSVGCCVASAIISSFIQETRRLSVSEHAVAGIILVYFFFVLLLLSSTATERYSWCLRKLLLPHEHEHHFDANSYSIFAATASVASADIVDIRSRKFENITLSFTKQNVHRSSILCVSSHHQHP